MEEEGGSTSPAPGAGGGTGEEEDAVGAAPFGVTSLRVRGSKIGIPFLFVAAGCWGAAEVDSEEAEPG